MTALEVQFSSSIAARVLQQCKSGCGIHGKLSQRAIAFACNFRRKYRSRSIDPRARRLGSAVDRFQSACKMQYDAAVWRLNLLMRAKRRCDGDVRLTRLADTDEKIFIGKGEQPAWLTLGACKSPRPRHRRHRNRKNRLAAGDGGRVCARRRSGFRRRYQGRPVRHLRSRRGQGFYRQAGRRYGPHLPARPVLDGVLGRVRRAGPSGARHRHGNGTAAAVAHARSERRAGGRAQRRLPCRRRARAGC